MTAGGNRFPGFAVLLGLAVALAAMLAAPARSDDARENPARLEFPGFSIVPPAGPLWAQVRSDSRSLVWMRRQPDAAHSFSVAVLTGALPAGARSRAEFEAWVRGSKFTSPDPERFLITESALGSSEVRTDGCLEYRLRAEDRGAEPVLVLTVAGLACRHPDAPDRYFDVQHAERQPLGGGGPSPRAEGEAFVAGFRFAAPPADGNWNLAHERARDPVREAT
jgi:hypothetical protein